MTIQSNRKDWQSFLPHGSKSPPFRMKRAYHVLFLWILPFPEDIPIAAHFLTKKGGDLGIWSVVLMCMCGVRSWKLSWSFPFTKSPPFWSHDSESPPFWMKRAYHFIFLLILHFPNEMPIAAHLLTKKGTIGEYDQLYWCVCVVWEVES